MPFMMDVPAPWVLPFSMNNTFLKRMPRLCIPALIGSVQYTEYSVHLVQFRGANPP